PRRQLRDLIVAIARIPNRHSSGITRAIAQDWGLDFRPPSQQILSMPSGEYSIVNGTECRTLGDIVEVLEEHAALLVEQLINQDSEFRIQNSEFNKSGILYRRDESRLYMDTRSTCFPLYNKPIKNHHYTRL
ncbi:hypothetical protein FM036_37755, partial [Nostoc sp. HG1]|nr:hypothetical protein [Nostoc sp. HG1]